MNEHKLNVFNHTVQKAFSNHILVFLLIFPFMIPAFLNEIRFGEVIDYYKIVVGVIILGLFLLQRKITGGIITIAVFYLSFIVSSIIKSANVSGAVIIFFNAVVFSIIINLGINNNLQVLCDVLTFNLFILWTGELVCLFLFPNGIYRDNYYYNAYGFINIDNQLAPLVIFSFFILMFNLIYKKRAVISIICLIEMVVAVFITWSATCIVVVLILLIYLLFFYKKTIENLLDIIMLLLIVVILFFAIVIFRVQEIFSFFIEDFLGKSITFTGRTEIWDLALYQIKQSILFGRGFYKEHGWIFWRYKFYYSHNLFLEILLLGGIFSLVSFIIMILVNISKINLKGNSTVASLINICIFAMGICCLTESYMTSVYFPALFVLAYNFNILSDLAPFIANTKNLEFRSK